MSTVQNLYNLPNVAESLDQETLDKIGEEIAEQYERDKTSRSKWETNNDEWMKLASQMVEKKSYPWPEAANVKYPLLTTAAVQFNARSYPALLRGNKPLQIKIFGQNPKPEKAARARRVSDYMSFQILEEIPNWSEGLDRLLHVLPIIGLVYKKTYYSYLHEEERSDLVLPKDLVVNYYAESFEEARKHHRLFFNRNELLSNIRKGLYLDVDLGEPTQNVSREGVADETIGISPPGEIDASTPHELIESHNWWDLDNDDYKEPWIITVDRESRKVLSIVPRFDLEDVEVNNKNQVVKIKPVEYFTDYHFIPNPESAIYSMGFGTLIGPLNHAVNTTVNQLLDSGSLSILQSGFLGRGIRMKGGAVRFRPGEWKYTQTTGDDLRKNIFPLPVQQPSTVLFQLLGLLVQSGEKLASITDALSGENPGQNQPLGTTLQVMEQGLKVFVSIFKRIYRSLTKEYKKLYRLNSIHIDLDRYIEFLDAFDIAREELEADFEDAGLDIRPSADPNAVTDAQKVMLAESLVQKLVLGLPLSTEEVTRRVLEAEGHEDVDILMDVPEPQPPLDIQLKMKQQEHQEKLDMLNIAKDVERDKYEHLKDLGQYLRHVAEAKKAGEEIDNQEVQSQIGLFKAKVETSIKQADAVTKRIQAMAQIKSADASMKLAEKPVNTNETNSR